MKILAISGSPSTQSKSRRLLSHVARLAGQQGIDVQMLDVRDLPGDSLMLANVDDPAVARAVADVASAQLLVVATPIYKAAYSGLLKAFLDLLPQTALKDKVVLPIATGGSPMHALAIDYALRPVLQSLGEPQILQGIYVADNACQWDGETPTFETRLQTRVDEGMASMYQASRAFAAMA